MVNYRLKLGLGVEDIALDMGCDESAIRFYIRSLRERGKLASVLFGRMIADDNT